MNFYYETSHLILKIEHHSIADKVLSFYKKNRPYFDAWEITRPDNFYTKAFQSTSLTYEYNEIIKRHALRFWIYDKCQYEEDSASAPIIGSISVSNIRRGAFQSGMIGYKLDHDYWGRGLAFEACQLVIDILFEEYDLHRIEAYIMPQNTASLRLIERLGFVREGIKFSCVEVNHRWEDHFQYGLIKNS